MNEEVDEFIKAGVDSLKESDHSRYYPFSFTRLIPYCSDLRSQKILSAVNSLKKQQISLYKIANSFPTLPTLRIETGLILIDLKIAGYSKRVRMELFKFFNDLIKIRAKRDFYGVQSCIEKTDEEIKKITGKIKFFKTSKRDAKNLGLLSASLASLSWALYNDNFPNQSYEIEGPYKLGDKQLLIKKNIRLKPVELFKHTQNYKYKDVEILAVYKKSLGIKLDSINHIVYKGNSVDAIEKAAIFVDGKSVTKSQVTSLIDYFGKCSKEQFRYFDALPFEDKKIFFLCQRDYSLKEFFELAKVDWKPTEKMLNRVKGRKLLPLQKKSSSGEDNSAMVELFDPRKDLPLKTSLQMKLFRMFYHR